MSTKRLSLVMLLLATACADSATDGLFYSDSSLRPEILGNSLAYLDSSNHSVIVVDPAGKSGPDGDRKLSRLLVGKSPSLMESVQTPGATDQRQLIVLDPADEQVLIIRNELGEMDSLSIGVPLESLDISGDGRWAVVYQRDGDSPSQRLFSFPNTIAIVDLHPDSPKATTVRLPDSTARPLKTVFAGSARLSGSANPEVELALVFVNGGIVPVDLAAGTAGTTIPLSSDRSENVTPAEVLFTNNRGDELRGSYDDVERAFVRTTEGEIFVLAIRTGGGADADGSQVRITLENVITPPSRVYDTELFFDDDGSAILLGAAGNEVVLVSGYTGVAAYVAPSLWTDSLKRYTDPITGQQHALAYSKYTPQSKVLQLLPTALDRGRSQGMTMLHFGREVGDIEMAEQAGLAVIRYQDTRELGLMALDTDAEVLELRFSNDLSALGLDPVGDHLWLVGRTPDGHEPTLAEIQLGDALSSQEVRLDADGRFIGRLGNYMWVDHGGTHGAVTFFPVGDLRRESAVAFRDFMLVDILEVAPPKSNEDVND